MPKTQNEDTLKTNIDPLICPGCQFFPCKCPSAGAASSEQKTEEETKLQSNPSSSQNSLMSLSNHHQSNSHDKRQSAVEMMDFNPFLGPLLDSDDPRPSENKRIKERFKTYLSIGFYRDLTKPDGSQMRYYLFADRHNPTDEIKTYSSLVELEQALQTDSGRKNIFRNTPKIFIEGHGGDDRYGVGGDHPRREEYKHFLEHPGIPTDPSEQIHGDNFDKIINDLKDVINPKPGKLFITLEVCNSDNLYLGKSLWGHEKTFLERLSESHKDLIFSGTGPWDRSHVDAAILTGARAPGGINTPIMSMGGSIWKPGNTVAFYSKFTVNNSASDYQVVVKKSKFASTQTAIELKINTIEYALKILVESSKDSSVVEKMLAEISANRDILKIKDLPKAPDFPQSEFKDQAIPKLSAQEKQILEREKNNYRVRAQEILARTKSGEKFTERDSLIIALGLKDFADNSSIVKGSVFEGNEKLLDDILSNKRLLELVMVACGKVLIAGPSNECLIDLLRSKDISVNSADEYGMTATHYAVQNFYIYRDEPLALVKKLLDCGASLELADQKGVTPYAIAMNHGSKEIVHGGEKLKELVQTKLLAARNSHAITSLMSTNLGLFRKPENKDLTEHRAAQHDGPHLQHAHDEKFGLVLKT